VLRLILERVISNINTVNPGYKNPVDKNVGFLLPHILSHTIGITWDVILLPTVSLGLASLATALAGG
jgi:hypothetical protein